MVSKGKLNEPLPDQGPDCCPPLSSSRASRTQKVCAYFCSEEQIYFQVIASTFHCHVEYMILFVIPSEDKFKKGRPKEKEEIKTQGLQLRTKLLLGK